MRAGGRHERRRRRLRLALPPVPARAFRRAAWPAARRPGAPRRRPRRARRACVPLQRSTRDGEDVGGAHPREGAQLHVTGDGEPCGTCASCVEIARGSSFDVHELDAASNNGVDAMRDLIAHAALATPGRWKVYIVDEVHMLSNAAANALLKTLEEPPGHVVFVLATTDPQKVPPTIRSRTQHFEFGLLSAEVLAGLLDDVNAAA